MAKKIIKKEEKDTPIDKRIKKSLPFIIFICVLVAVFFASYYFFKGLNVIEYGGMTFTKGTFGSVILYRTSYNVVSADGRAARYELYLRTNPKENNVPVEGKIFYPAGRTVYTAVNESGLNCELTLVAISELGQFLAGNLLKTKAGTLDYERAISENITYVSCEKYPENTVIIIKAGNETKITNKETNVSGKENCYTISVANCEIVPAVEKFIVQSLVDSREN